MNRLTNLENAVYVEACQSYCFLISKDGQKTIKSRPMKFFANTFLGYGWIQIHKKYTVNPEYIAHFTENRDGICLENGIVLPNSRRKKKEIMAWRKNICM